jgi:sulfide:quinone oxidoreductase
MKTIILGGGAGGIAAACLLRARLTKEHEVVLVERRPAFHLGASKIWVMLGHRKREEVETPLSRLTKRGIELVAADVEKIDAAKREVTTSKGAMSADFLVVALGADHNLAAVPGLDRAAHSFYDMDAAIRLGGAIRAFEGGDILILNPRMPIKCPPAPYEVAMHLDDVFAGRKMRDKVRLSLATVEPLPMPTAGPEVGRIVKEEIAKRNVAFHPQKKVKSADADRKVVVFEDGEMKYDLLIAVPPHEAPKVARDAGLVSEKGWIPVDPRTLKTKHDRVWAIGDVAGVPLPGRYKPDAPLALPKAAVFAEAHARVVVDQIAAAVEGKESTAAFDGVGFCYVEMGGQHAMGGDGKFFETPAPKVATRVPDKTQLDEKLAWAARFMREYLE